MLGRPYHSLNINHWSQGSIMYQEDSFFSLSSLGQIGLGFVSVALSLAVLAIAWRLMRGRRIIMRLGIATIIFFLFVWLSPQVFYTYYIFIFNEVSWQNVIKRPPTPFSLAQYISFQGRATLSAHSKGILFWALIVLALIPISPLKRPSRRA